MQLGIKLVGLWASHLPSVSSGGLHGPPMLHIFLCFHHTWLIMRAASSCTFVGRGLETIFLTLGSRNSKLFSYEYLQEQDLYIWVPWWSVVFCRKSLTRLL